MITKEENRQLKKVEQEVVLAPPWTSLICLSGEEAGCKERRGKNVVHQLIVTLENVYNGAAKKTSLAKECDL